MSENITRGTSAFDAITHGLGAAIHIVGGTVLGLRRDGAARS